MSLFPGLTISLLALVGALGGVYARRLRIGLAAGVVLCALLSLGVRDVEGLERYLTPFRLLHDFAPGWDAVRAPGRINTLTSLGLALLAGAGLCVILRRLRARVGASQRRLARTLPATTGAVLVAAVLAEGLGPLAHPTVPPVPAAQRLATPPLFHLPAGFVDDSTYSYWSIEGFPEIVNGAGGFDPDAYDRLRKTAVSFPDAESVAALRTLGVRTVLLHSARAEGTFWEEVARRPIAGLPVEREEAGDVVLFRLEPLPSS
ncbi:MAG: hypothetical protein RMM28_09075 [Thermoleophilia bacterium]|nr:hypothetical protein [Gaiellaceae bacterium]MDW8339276.1 hypothetical protein [Thermoleophilia bacterium]